MQNWKIHKISLLLILIFFSTPFWVAGEEKAKPLNIIWLIGENLGPDLGCYGANQVDTPNLDKLAANGVRYTHAFSTAPVCSSARAAFMSGMYQTSIGVHNHPNREREGFQLPPNVRPITHRLKEAGYFTANIRKIGKKVVGTGKTHFAVKLEEPLFESEDWNDLITHQPFYAQVNAHFVERGTIDPTGWHKSKEFPDIADREKVKIPPYYPDHEITRNDIAQYFNSVSALDRSMGVVLEQLEKDGLADNTVIMFFGDNGRLELRGLNWCYDSGVHIPLIIKWPNGHPAPANYFPGSVSDQLISGVDLTATTLALAGVDKPTGMESRVFFGHGPLDEPRNFVIAARDRTDEVVQRIRSVRTHRFRYVKNFMPEQYFAKPHIYKDKIYPILGLMRDLHKEGKLTPTQAALMEKRLPDEELYDIENDPYEIHNLADSKNPEHQQKLIELRATLEEWIETSNDQGRYPEDSAEIEYWTTFMKNHFKNVKAIYTPGQALQD